MRLWQALVLLAFVFVAGCTAARDGAVAPGALDPSPGSPGSVSQTNDPWVLTATRLDDAYRGTFLGNGTIGQRVMEQGTGWWHGMASGGGRGKSGQATFTDPRDARSAFVPGPLPAFMAGLYEQEHLVTIPSPTAVDLAVGDQAFMADPRRIRRFRQTLSMRDGLLMTEADWDTGSGHLRVEITTLVARHDPHLAMVRLRLAPERRMDLELRHSNQLAGEPSPGGDFDPARTAVSEGGMEWVTTTRHGRVPFAQVERLVWGERQEPRHEPGSEVPHRAPSAARSASPAPNLTQGLIVRRGTLSGPTTITRFVATASGRDTKDPLAAARASAERAVKLGAEGVLGPHREAWARLWQSDIEIEGQPEDQQAVRSFLFYLLQCARDHGDASIPPMGLSAATFGGHIFWDAETWIFPPLLALHPQMAKVILEYRYRTLPAARQAARAAGYAGASYAWQSAQTGQEQAPEPFRHGRHVTADVALAAWQYYAATGDRNWLANRGWPILEATADYWVSRARPAAGGRLAITRVTTPDENAGLVDNSAWVNFAARRNLEVAARTAAILGRKADPRWARVAKGLILSRDPETGLIMEHDAYRGQKIKQADTLLLIFPGDIDLPNEEKERLYDYYAPRAIEVGPAMTDSIHAIVAARLGRAQEAYQRFRDSFQPFLRAPFLMFSEKRTRDALYFVTGAGGSLQAVLFGFGGLSLGDPDTPTVTPLLPPAWQSLTLRGVAWQGRRYDRAIRVGSEPTWTPVGAISGGS